MGIEVYVSGQTVDKESIPVSVSLCVKALKGPPDYSGGHIHVPEREEPVYPRTHSLRAIIPTCQINQKPPSINRIFHTNPPGNR